jgi:ABC-type branched-subunit amino acid transport system permease subunit
VFVIACALVGIQGALQASFVHYISPLSYGFAESLKLVVINVIGGLNTLWGPTSYADLPRSLTFLSSVYNNYQGMGESLDAWIA